MAGWSYVSTRRRNFSSTVQVSSPSPVVSCSNGSFGPASPSRISIRGVASGGAYTKSPSAANVPVRSVSSKTARLTVLRARAQSPKPCDFARQRWASATSRPSHAGASSERVVLRALPVTRRRQSSAAGPVSQPPSLGSVPELCEAAGAEQFEELASQPTMTVIKSVNRPFPETRKASLRLQARRKSVPSSTDPDSALPISTTCVPRVSSMKTLRFEGEVMPSSGAA
ncbi:hypothetical protein HPB52_020666 [Rhipicephalus sanguineus]|uniref:Uncharacterized protein n=1 Tax=Rhipicephalus sanguineus TaxID=34632 RepID=A0A9D4Q3E0_RHISA|nr:hypothetical protein HPB52_020666 [Rhipicephalus sanguineus]